MTKQCEDCGADSPIIGRFAGFFGVQPRYSRYCVDCIGAHASEHPDNPDPEALKRELTAAVEAEEHRIANHRRRKRSV